MATFDDSDESCKCEKRKFSIPIQGSQNDAHQFKFKPALPDRSTRFVNFCQLLCQLLRTVFEFAIKMHTSAHVDLLIGSN